MQATVFVYPSIDKAAAKSTLPHWATVTIENWQYRASASAAGRRLPIAAANYTLNAGLGL